MGRQLLVAGIGDVVPLRPVADRDHVDVHEHRDEIAAVAERHRLVDVRKELQLVLDEFGREQRAVVQLPDILGAIDDPEMPALIEVARVTGMHPAVDGLGVVGRLRVLEILLEHARAAVEHLARIGDLELDLGDRLADRVGEDLAVGMDGDEHRGLGLAVELLHVDAKRAVEVEDLRSHCFARG